MANYRDASQEDRERSINLSNRTDALLEGRYKAA